MKFSPKHSDFRMRIIYASLVLCSFIFMNVGTGLTHTILLSVALVFLAFGLYLFLRHDLTTFTYIVLEKDDRLDFYVDKSMGKKGSYVCYFPLSDALFFTEYKKGVKKEISEKFGKTFFYNYRHNRFCTDNYVIVFQNDDHCDAIICQLDQKSAEFLRTSVSKNESSEA